MMREIELATELAVGVDEQVARVAFGGGKAVRAARGAGRSGSRLRASATESTALAASAAHR